MAEERAVINKLELYTLAGVKRRLGLSDQGMRSLRRQGLPVIRIGNRAYFTGEHLIDFFSARAKHGSESVGSETGR